MTFEQLNEFVKGKTVAALGRASYVLKDSNSCKGRYIDGHDVVARANSVYPYGSNVTKQNNYFIDPNLWGYLGSKTNLFYVSSSVLRDDINNQMLQLFVKDEGIAVCSAEHTTTRKNAYNNIVLVKNIASFHVIPENIRQQMLFDYKTFAKEKTTQRDNQKQTRNITPTVGLLMLQELLLCDVKLVSVIGFTCGFDMPLDANVRWFLEKHRFHDPAADLLWLQLAREKDSRLIFDDTLERILVEQKDILDKYKQDGLMPSIFGRK